jgi:hypothetical protein
MAARIAPGRPLAPRRRRTHNRPMRLSRSSGVISVGVEVVTQGTLEEMIDNIQYCLNFGAKRKRIASTNSQWAIGERVRDKGFILFVELGLEA